MTINKYQIIVDIPPLYDGKYCSGECIFNQGWNCLMNWDSNPFTGASYPDNPACPRYEDLIKNADGLASSDSV